MATGARQNCSAIDTEAFSFCRTCTKADRCCTALGPHSDLPAPILTRAEADRIRSRVGKQVRDFVTPVAESRTIVRLVTNADGSCIFHRVGRCTIYDVRPFDCKVFPLDILLINQRYCWVVYTAFCGHIMDLAAMLAYGESLLAKQDEGFLQDFAWDTSIHPCRLRYDVLKEIQQPSPVTVLAAFE